MTELAATVSRIRLVVILATAMAVLTGCVSTQKDVAEGLNDPLLYVSSACDEHGNRVYKWAQGLSSAHPVGGIAVVPADATCQQPAT